MRASLSKPKAAKGLCAPLTFGFYSKSVESFESRDAACEALGNNICCQSHAARVVKKQGNCTFLRCRLRSSTPPCQWAAMLVVDAEGRTELMQHPLEFAAHNVESKPKGKIGLPSLEERKTLTTLLTSRASAKPAQALHTARNLKEGQVKKTQLKQVQALRRSLSLHRFSSRRMGELRTGLAKFGRAPLDPAKGYFVVRKLSKVGQRPKLTVVATTEVLMRRFAGAKRSPVSADGGFGQNLLGWPTHVIGVSNDAGQYACCGIGMTSSMEAEHVTDMAVTYAQETKRVTGLSVHKDFVMSDQEAAYRRALKTAFHGSNLMCVFHVKSACRDYLFHGLRGTTQEKQTIWDGVSKDLDLIRGAQTPSDFESRCRAVQQKWKDEGLDTATSHQRKDGTHWDFLQNFQREWVEKAPEWFIGASPMHSTNNGAESSIKQVKFLSGGVVGSVADVLAFAIERVESLSLDEWDPDKKRPINRALWQRAAAFSAVIGQNKVRQVSVGGVPYYVASARADPDDSDVSNRPPLSIPAAREIVHAFVAQLGGADTSVANLERFAGGAGARVFKVVGQEGTCSCPAFYGPRHCFHTLGLLLKLQRVEIPDDLDPTPVGMAARGNKPRAAVRRSMPLKADEKDLLICQLRNQVKKLSKSRPDTEPVALPVPLTPRKRLRTKMPADLVQPVPALARPAPDLVPPAKRLRTKMHADLVQSVPALASPGPDLVPPCPDLSRPAPDLVPPVSVSARRVSPSIPLPPASWASVGAAAQVSGTGGQTPFNVRWAVSVKGSELCELILQGAAGVINKKKEFEEGWYALHCCATEAALPAELEERLKPMLRMPAARELQGYLGHIVGVVYCGASRKIVDLTVARRELGPCVDHSYGNVAVPIMAAVRVRTLLPASGQSLGAWRLPQQVAVDLLQDEGVSDFLSQWVLGTCGCGDHAVCDPACPFYGRSRGSGISPENASKFREDIAAKTHEQKQHFLLTSSREQSKVVLAKDSSWVLRMPGDNHCCFHALNHCLGKRVDIEDALSLRRRLMQALVVHADAREYAAVRMALDLVGETVDGYVAKMREPLDEGTPATSRHWGGAIEIAIFVRINPAYRVSVFEERGQQYVCIQTYGAPAAEKQARLLYRNGVHWDVLLRQVARR